MKIKYAGRTYFSTQQVVAVTITIIASVQTLQNPSSPFLLRQPTPQGWQTEIRFRGDESLSSFHPFEFLELGLDNGATPLKLVHSDPRPPFRTSKSVCSCSLVFPSPGGTLSAPPCVLQCSGFWSLICLKPSSFSHVQFTHVPSSMWET